MAFDAYYERLSLFTKSGRRAKPQRDVPDEWREPPGYPGYLLNSVTRELWSEAREVTTTSGVVRRYPARLITPVNGAVSLSVNGVRSSRGVQALWNATFGGKKNGKAEAPEPYLGEGLAEWLATGSAGIVTRPGGMKEFTAAEEEKFREAGEQERAERANRRW